MVEVFDFCGKCLRDITLVNRKQHKERYMGSPHEFVLVVLKSDYDAGQEIMLSLETALKGSNGVLANCVIEKEALRSELLKGKLAFETLQKSEYLVSEQNEDLRAELASVKAKLETALRGQTGIVPYIEEIEELKAERDKLKERITTIADKLGRFAAVDTSSEFKLVLKELVEK